MLQRRAGLLFLAGILIGAVSAAVVTLALAPDGAGGARARQPGALPAGRGAVRAARGPAHPGAAAGRDGAQPATGVVRVTDGAAGALKEWIDVEWEGDRAAPALGAVLELYALAGRAPEFAATAQRLLEYDAEAATRVLAAVDLLPPELQGPLLEELAARCPAMQPRMLEVAGRLATAGRIERAFELLAVGLRDPGAAERIGSLGPLLGADADRTANLLIEAARANSWSSAAWNSVANQLFALERGDLALRALRSAIDLGMTDNETLSTALEIDPATAELLAMRLIEADAKNTSAWAILGEARNRRGDLDGAFQALVQYAKLERGREALETLLNLDPGRALAVVAELTADTTDDEAIGALAINYKQLGRTREAWDTYYRAHLIDPTDSEWLSEMVALDAVRSVDVFEKRLEDGYGINSDEMLGSYAQALLGAGRPEDAWEQFVKAFQLDPTDSEWIDGMGSIDAYRTIDFLQAELERNPGNDTAFSSLAAMLGKVGRPEEALSMMRELIDREPSPTGWLMTLSTTMPAEAEAMTRGKLQDHPRDDELWGTLGKILFNQGREAGALEAFRKANEIDPGDGEWHGYLEQLGHPVTGNTAIGVGGVWDTAFEPD